MPRLVRTVALTFAILFLDRAPAQAACMGDVCFADLERSGHVVLGPQQGGLAVLDHNGDGFQDLVFSSSGGPTHRLFANVPNPAVPGGRGFLDVTSGSGLADADSASRVSLGILAFDYDGDGDADLYFTGRASDDTFGLLYRNEGRGRFTNVSVAAGLRGAALRAQSASVVDFDLDGDPDLLVGGNLSAVPVRLYRNEGDGTFSDASALLPAITGVSNLYAHVWFDFDADGDSDGFLLSAGPGPRLLRNDVDASGMRFFTEASAQVGYTVLGPAPMGAAAGDYDGDGDLDLAITDAQDGTYYRNDGGQMTRVDLVPAQFGWGVAWLDADNDGDLDHYQAGSYAQVANGGPSQIDKLFRNDGGGTFTDVSPALDAVAAASRWSVALDIDDDGRVDLVTMNPGDGDQSVSVYRNTSPSAAAWLKLRLRGTDGVTRDAVGATVRLHAGGSTQVREVALGSSTSSSEDARLHFGLGAASTVDAVEIVWPRSGTVAERTEIYPGPFPLRTTVTLQPHDPALPCLDAVDDDGDGRTDYPADPGCTSAEDPSEEPECADDLDNDADGFIDHPADPGCASPDGPSERGACGLLGLEALIALGARSWRRRGTSVSDRPPSPAAPASRSPGPC